MIDQFSNSKIFYHDDKIKSILNNQVTLPSVVELSLSGKCNHNCVYCCCKSFKSNTVLNQQQIDAIISQLKDFIKAVTITGGGEPLTNPHFEYCVRRLSEYNIPYGVITNGGENGYNQLEKIVDTASFCRISLDSANNDTYKRIRSSKNNVSRVLQTMHNLSDLKVNRKSQILIGAQIVLVDQSIEDIRYTIKMSKECGIDFIQIRPADNIPYEPFSPNYSKINSYEVALESMQEELSDAKFKVLPNTDKLEEYYSKDVRKGYTGCKGGNLTAAIGHDNKVYFCCAHIGDVKYLLGDLNEQPLIDILYGSRRFELIHGCDKQGCQFQCRNHKINKLIEKIDPTKIDEILANFSQAQKPVHWQFL